MQLCRWSFENVYNFVTINVQGVEGTRITGQHEPIKDAHAHYARSYFEL